MENIDVNVLEENDFIPEIEKRQSTIDNLRLDGVTKIEALRNEISNFKRNKQLDKETRAKLIAKNNEEIEAAKVVKNQNSAELQSAVNENIGFIENNYKVLIKKEKEKNKATIQAAKADYEAKLAQFRMEKDKELSKFNEEWLNKTAEPGKEKEFYKQKKIAKDDIMVGFKTKCNDAKVAFDDVKEKCKDNVHALYANKYGYMEKANDKKLPFLFGLEQKWENYSNSFTFKNFLLKNGLYLTILFLMIVATIAYAVQTGLFLFDSETILMILNQTSPRIFLALGVAGLIVLAGTDLSIGRLVGMSAVFTGMLVTTTGETTITFFGKAVSFTAIPLGARVVFAFLLSIVACTLISGIAGFFTAKFKMHPFISTLATQLFTFGIMAGVTGNAFTGLPDPNVSAIIAGKGLIEGSDFPIMILWAAIGVAIMWVIWNKTTFGKNMFAVGGNAEAASVSGINVFKVTLGVFILAGIYYGIGGSIFSIYSGNVRAMTGQAMEADAIAACVVGGVSFSGGVGKISGVVVGALIFQAICVVLPMIGITDANYQLAIKGVIILAAVTLDCVKYLKKK